MPASAPRGRLRCLAALLLALVACSAQGPSSTRPPGAGTPPPSPTPAASPAPAPTPATAVRFAAVGDIGQGNDIQRAVGEAIAALHRERPIDVLLLLGDIIYPDGAGHRYEDRFAEPWRAVLEADIRIAAALGNHDVQTRDGADVMELFGMPGRYYSLRVGPVAFFALDTNRFDRAQLEWLRSELDRHDDVAWSIPFMHAPAYSSGRHGSTSYVRSGLEPILREYEVPLVLAGHDHNYERTHPIGGTVHVVAGTGCCLRAVGSSSFTAVARSEPGVFVADADTSTLTMRFVHADGRVLDEIRLPSGSHARSDVRDQAPIALRPGDGSDGQSGRTVRAASGRAW